ncbi:TetR/AcrR family transcriptional regulator [Streptomyces sp. E11-3]|uniref:TetR/AcrR family transcriptional regulator n=1 Tax=Streptomyces sp. E11-3 TaxID=3110112 RepID=UPI00397EADF6
MVRMSAAERRESVIRAAITEFARGGYKGTSTEVIAKRVGVSQPYLFRLFKNKQELFLAAATRCVGDIRQVLVESARDVPPEGVHMAMANAYKELLAADPDMLLMQMQAYVAVASAEAAGDREFGEGVRAAWEDLWDSTHLILGADAHETTYFHSYGMLINALVSMGFPPEHRVWSGFAEFPAPE